MKKILMVLSFIYFFLPMYVFPLVYSNAEEEVQRVEIIVDSYSFRPDAITVEAGIPVEITLRSVASMIPHDFTIDDPASGLTVTQDVRGGRDATFTFTPENPGTYKFYCSKSGLFGASHEERGMVGTITVK